MKQDTADHMVRERPPADAQRNYGMLTAGVLVIAAIGTAIYWVA